MNFELIIENYTKGIISNKFKTLFLTLVIILFATSGARFLETPSGYRAFVENDQPNYQDILNLEEKYGMIDTLSYVIKPNNGDIFQKDALKLISELTDISWQTPYSSRVSSLTNHQYTTVNGDDININDFIEDVDSLTSPQIIKLKEIALKEKTIVNFILSESSKVSFVNINLDVPIGVGFDEPINFAEEQKKIFNEKYPEIFVTVAGSARYSHNFQTTAQSDAKTMYPGFLILIIFLSYVLLRSVTASIISLLVIFLSILPSLGSAGWLGFEAQPPLLIAPIIILTIALAHAIHILSIALTNMNEGMNKEDAIIESIKINFTPVFLTSFTTAVGVAGVNFGKIPAFSEMANTVVMGSAYSFLISITILPIVFMMVPIKPHGKPTVVLNLLKKLGLFISKFKYYLVLFIALASLYFINLIPNLYFDDDFDSYFDRVESWVEVKNIVNDEFGSSFFIFANLSSEETDGITSPKYLETLDKFAEWLEEQDEVVTVTSVSDIIKTLNKNMNGGSDEYYIIPDDKPLNAQYLLMYEFSVPYGMDLKNQMTADKSESRLLIRLNMTTSRESIKFAERTQTWIDQNLKEFKSDGIVGIPVMMPYVYRQNTDGLMRGLLFSFSFIVILIGITLKSFRYGLISMIPNIVPFILSYGVLALFTNIVTFSHTVSILISLGLVVDATIHFLTKFKKANSEGLNPDEAIQYCFKYVGYPIIVASICLFSGFLFLLQSSFQTNFVLGGMCALIIVIALVIDLLLLPAILLIFGKMKQ
tara:strand:+ start:3777 stop:6068 length:2292 start_codon:yes stop_codon:yes gene_type:complete